MAKRKKFKKKYEKNKMLILGIVGVAVLITLSLFLTNTLSLTFDDFSTVEDFTIADPVFTEACTSPNVECTQDGPTKFYRESERFITFRQDQSALAQFTAEKARIEWAPGHVDIIPTQNTGCVTLKGDYSNRDIKVVTEMRGFYAAGRGRFPSVTVRTVVNGVARDLVGSDTKETFVFQFTKDITNKNKWIVDVNGFEMARVDTRENIEICGYADNPAGREGSYVRILEIKDRPFFNCEIEADEVVVVDKFVGPQTFTIDDLTYKPEQFCIDNYPAILRSLEEEGSRADIRGQLTRTLAEGRELNVDENEIIEVYYVTDYTEGMGERCGIDSALNQEGKCEKVINEEADIIEIVGRTEFIEVGSQQAVLKDSGNIGQKRISTSTPRYLCEDEDENTVSPKPRPDCWQVDVNFDGQRYTFNADETKEIDDFVSIQVVPIASFFDGEIQEGAFNNIIVNIDSNSVLKPIIPERTPEDYYIPFGEEVIEEVMIQNQYTSFSQEQAGFKITKTKGLVFAQDSELVPKSMPFGESDRDFELDTSQMGQITYELVPYFKIGEKFFFDEERIILNYEVVRKEDIPELIKNGEIPKTVSENVSNIFSAENVVLGVLVLAGVGVVVFLYFKAKPRKKRRK